MARILIKNGRLIDPANGIDEPLDLLIENGKIAKVGKDLPSINGEIIEASGKVVAPGLVDLHAHLRDPGFTYREDIKTGTAGGAVGGFTSIACMPNTNPVIDNPEVVNYVLSKAKREGLVNIYVIGSITKGQAGEELSPMEDLVKSGVVLFSDDGQSVMNAMVMKRALEKSGSLNRTLSVHCEDKNLTANGVMNEGEISRKLGLKGIPPSSETVMVARDIVLAEETKGRLHICHVGTATSVDLIRWGKDRGVNLTAEVTPHHLALTEEAVEKVGTSAKIKPPLGTLKDLKALKEGLREGTIDCIVTDHAPYAPEEKAKDFSLAPSGLIGLETTFSLVIGELVIPGILSLSKALATLTINPARVLGIPKGTLSVGADADVILIDLNKEWIVDVNKYQSKSRNCPYNGRQMKGKVELTIVGGRIVNREGRLLNF